MGRDSDLLIEQMLEARGIITEERTTSCCHCGKAYLQRTESQMAGFREMDYDLCPYCGESNGSSMQVDFYNSKIK